jgi:hypothetical protein
MIIGLGVLVLGEVQRCGMLHQAHADAVREQVAEQALEQRGEARQPFAGHRDSQLERHQPGQMPPVHRGARRPCLHRRDHAVDDELADPQDGERHEGPQGPQREDGDRVAAVRLIHQPQERRHVSQRLQPLSPGGRLPVSLGQEAPRRGEHPVRDESWRRGHTLNFLRGESSI